MYSGTDVDCIVALWWTYSGTVVDCIVALIGLTVDLTCKVEPCQHVFEVFYWFPQHTVCTGMFVSSMGFLHRVVVFFIF